MIDKSKIRPDLPGIVVLSHGTMCHGLIESADMIVGGMDQNVFAFSYMPGADFTDYASEVLDLYTALPEGSIILFDMFGGTPFNQVLMACAQQNIPLHGLCGVSLPILIEATAQRDCCKGEELIQQLQEAGNVALINVKEYLDNLLDSNQELQK